MPHRTSQTAAAAGGFRGTRASFLLGPLVDGPDRSANARGLRGVGRFGLGGRGGSRASILDPFPGHTRGLAGGAWRFLVPLGFTSSSEGLLCGSIEIFLAPASVSNRTRTDTETRLPGGPSLERDQTDFIGRPTR